MSGVQVRPASLATGILTRFPGGNAFLQRRNDRQGGTFSAEYCYSVWLRHLIFAHEVGVVRGVPPVVAELGPGNSLGAGLAALLSGAEQYHAFDLVRHGEIGHNLVVLDALVALFRTRSVVVGGPSDVWDFPGHILNEQMLARTLAPERVETLRTHLLSLDKANGGSESIHYHAPWYQPGVLTPDSVDMIFSVSVLEHVDDLLHTYQAAFQWLRPGAFMAHRIDFGAHRHATPWNGHWAISRRLWQIMRGRRPYFINRQPCGVHIDLLRRSGFEIVREVRHRDLSGLRRSQLAAEFRSISDEDLATRSVYIVARKPI